MEGVVTVIVFVETVLVIVIRFSGVQSLRHCSIFTAVQVEGKVLIELESAKRNRLNLVKSGVDKTLSPQLLTTPFLITRPETRYIHKRATTNLVRNSRS